MATNVITTREEVKHWFLENREGSVICRSGAIERECFSYLRAIQFFNTVEGKDHD